MKLDTLLVRAGIGKWAGWVWFRDAQLSGQTLQVAAEVEPTVRRCYLPTLRVVLPALALVSLSENRPGVVRMGTGRAREGAPMGTGGLSQPKSLFPED